MEQRTPSLSRENSNNRSPMKRPREGGSLSRENSGLGEGDQEAVSVNGKPAVNGEDLTLRREANMEIKSARILDKEKLPSRIPEEEEELVASVGHA